MTLAQITDYETRGVALLIERYRKPRISALLKSWLSEAQAVENAFWQLLTKRAISNACGASLDVLGRIVGQPRNGLSDAQYRVWVSARAMVLRSSGRVQDLLAVAQRLVPSSTLRIDEYFPASQILRFAVPFDFAVGMAMARTYASAKAAGVRTFFVWWTTTQPFTFAPGTDVVSNSPYGFDAGVLAAVSDGQYVPTLSTIPLDALLGIDSDTLLYDGNSDYLQVG